MSEGGYMAFLRRSVRDSPAPLVEFLIVDTRGRFSRNDARPEGFHIIHGVHHLFLQSSAFCSVQSQEAPTAAPRLKMRVISSQRGRRQLRSPSQSMPTAVETLS